MWPAPTALLEFACFSPLSRPSRTKFCLRYYGYYRVCIEIILSNFQFRVARLALRTEHKPLSLYAFRKTPGRGQLYAAPYRAVHLTLLGSLVHSRTLVGKPTRSQSPNMRHTVKTTESGVDVTRQACLPSVAQTTDVLSGNKEMNHKQPINDRTAHIECLYSKLFSKFIGLFITLQKCLVRSLRFRHKNKVASWAQCNFYMHSSGTCIGRVTSSPTRDG